MNDHILETVTNWTDEQLQAAYANCRTTGALCTGHGKAHWNGVWENYIEKEMKRRRIMPDGREGVFNGFGSY